ncbi:helix-turn-helix domain-containing protein [Paenibacillus sp. GXUN7292]|uniref:helix-turn-helix domain-containing protein n=1 Tax=Paenibacillus sp. GXUN7292 TaxID=3422499 RepID=UPI003D7D6E0B
MNEGMNAFQINSFPLLSNKQQVYGSEQLFKICLQQLLLTLIRNSAGNRERQSLITITRENQTADMVNQLIQYIEQHLSEKITLDELCAHINLGKTQTNIMFKRATGLELIAYVNKTKIEHAKKYIREETYNISEVANLLGYSSIHYFSRHFKKETGMTPSDYAKTIKARYEKME